MTQKIFRHLALFSVLLLAACNGATGLATYRDTGVAIGATTRFEVERFWGSWHVRETYANTIAHRRVALESDQRGGLLWQVDRLRCEGSACVTERSEAFAREAGAGRLLLLDGSSREIWVLWVDADFRTAAIGTPDGQLGYILDRRPTGGADRIAAAREVMDFNGFDVSQLQVVSQ